MQLRPLLYAVALSLVASHTHAQQHAGVIKNDTARHQPVAGSKPAGALLAANTPAINDGKKKYNHVPLAGETAYFGDKTDYVTSFVRKYLELHYNTLSNVQNKSANPFSVIDEELAKRNMPKELKYLAVIESALNYNAVSRAGAVGPWQLMATTARMLGLTVTRKHDERRDLYKSTVAATRYLEDLYTEMNDWLLVIAAYNSGPVPVERAIERTGSRNFWDIKPYLPHETQGHVLAFIATATIFENLSKFISLGSIPVDFKFGKEEETPAPALTGVPTKAPSGPANQPAGAKPVTVTAQPAGTTIVKKASYTEDELKNMCIVRITEPLYMDLLAQELGVDKNLLSRWNNDYEMYVYKTYPTPFYNLRIPKDKLDLFLKKKDMLNKKSKEIFAANK